jgi:hypothetical protein
MEWELDIDTRKLVNASSKRSVNKIPLSFEDKYQVKVSVFKSGDPYIFSGSIVVILKAASRPHSQELAYSEFPVSLGSEASGILDLYTAELDSHLPLGGEVPLSLEITVLSGAAEISSLTVPAPTTRRMYTPGSPGPTAVIESLATQPEAEAGVLNNKWMSPLRVNQAFESFASSSGITFMPTT